ncbi:hypothetical protein [Micromonospora luteifusca]|uniref:hypothetical protein n=1 Tax=Micromonospora luteifusca TaxID=709860 RepID=UPI0033AAFC61
MNASITTRAEVMNDPITVCIRILESTENGEHFYFLSDAEPFIDFHQLLRPDYHVACRHTADEHGAMPISNECTEKHPQDDFPVRASFDELAECQPAFTHNVL